LSTDVALAWNCPHLTVEEHVTLGADRRSLVTRQPIAGVATVRILINDEIYIPQTGLYNPALLSSSVSGPYDLFPQQDSLTVTTSAGAFTLTLGLTTTARYTATDIVNLFIRVSRQLNQQIAAATNTINSPTATPTQKTQAKGNLLAANTQLASLSGFTPLVENGHLAFEDATRVGPDSYIKVSGTAAAPLGFGADGVNGYQQRARGSQLYPSWHVIVPPGTTSQVGSYTLIRFPKFDFPVRSNPTFKVTYTTAGQQCLRCGATLVENDVRFDNTGETIMLVDDNLLYQAAMKIILTDLGSNPYNPWYGTTIRQRIGSKALSGVATLIHDDIRKALAKFQALQAGQAKYQQVSFKERLYSVDTVNVTPHPQDPSTFLIAVAVRNASYAPINLTTIFTVPSVVALMGSNGLMLGTDAAGLLTTQTQPPAILLGGSTQ
jgi:hypothetical protein